MAMLAGLAGGFVIQQKFAELHEALPQIGRGKGDGLTFKLSVRVISASVPALGPPGAWSRQRPRLEATLGDTQKGTELADYIVDDNTIGLDKAYQCPWRFGETLTFVGRVADVLSAGLRVSVRAQSDFQLGPVQFQFSGVSELGEASIDIRKRALPACIGNQKHGKDTWESPVLVIPLSHVRGGKCGADHGLGDAVGHVTLLFSVDTDPETILADADAETRCVADRAADAFGVSDFLNWMEKPLSLDSPWLPQSLEQPPTNGVGYGPGSNIFDPLSTFLAPSDLPPDGWITFTAPNGRTFWHHSSLGPAPWEQGASLQSSPLASNPKALPGYPGQQLAGLQSTREPCREVVTNIRDQIAYRSSGDTCTGDAKSGAPRRALRPCAGDAGAFIGSPAKPKVMMDSPDMDPAGWVSHQGANGRLFWHHMALGPPPWELKGHHPWKPTTQCMDANSARERWAI